MISFERHGPGVLRGSRDSDLLRWVSSQDEITECERLRSLPDCRFLHMRLFNGKRPCAGVIFDEDRRVLAFREGPCAVATSRSNVEVAFSGNDYMNNGFWQETPPFD